MRKYIIGAVFGFILSIGISAHAEVTNMIGKTIEGVFDVTVNKQKLPTSAVVIDGNTYLPVRVIADAVGYKVSFDPDNGVFLAKKIITDRSTIKSALDAINVGIQNAQNSITDYENEILSLEKSNNANKENEITRLKKEIETSKIQISTFEKDKLKWNESLDELNQQEAGQ